MDLRHTQSFFTLDLEMLKYLAIGTIQRVPDIYFFTSAKCNLRPRWMPVKAPAPAGKFLWHNCYLSPV